MKDKPDLIIDFEERLAMMMEGGATELQARQQARRELRDRYHKAGETYIAANILAMIIENEVLDKL